MNSLTEPKATSTEESKHATPPLNGVNGVKDINKSSYEGNKTISPRPLSSLQTADDSVNSSINITNTDDVDTLMTSAPAESLFSTATADTDPAVHQPTSDLRIETEPVSQDTAKEIKEEKQQQDLAADDELANGIAHSDGPSIEHTLSPKPAPAKDIMDISAPTNAESESVNTEPVDVAMGNASDLTTATDASNIELPHHPVVPSIETPSAVAGANEASGTPAINPPSEHSQSQPQDQSMQDIPPSPSKVARGREEEGTDDEPATKRFRTIESTSEAPEFKVPEPPLLASGASVDASSTTVNTSAPGPSKLLAAKERQSNATYDLPMTKPQHNYLKKRLLSLKKNSFAVSFNQPVDPVALNIPSYPDIIKNPMDLKTMDTKLKNGDYHTVADYARDFDYVVGNAVIFNGSEHPVTQAAFHLRDIFDRDLKGLPSHDIAEPTSAEKKAKKASTAKPPTQRRESRSSIGTAKSPTASSTQTFALGPQGIPLIRRDSTAADGRPRREIHPPAPKDLPYSTQKPKKKKYQWELKFCQEVLNELKRPKYQTVSWPFQAPVDPVAMNIPSYHKVIKKPMDLSTVDLKLKSGQYENAKEFEADVRLMFSNCYKFNPADHAVHKAGKSYEEIFDEKWSSMKVWIRDHAPSSGAQSPGSSPEPEEEEESEDEEDEEEENQLSFLQKQIAGLSKQVEAIQKKKASPPVPAKKVRGKPTKKETKKTAPKGDKKQSKSTKKDKIPYVTYDQKQEISSRINTLPENKMMQALTIIRDNMPNLKVSLKCVVSALSWLICCSYYCCHYRVSRRTKSSSISTNYPTRFSTSY